jgi:Tfp pilus assembly protein PilF
MLKAPVLVAFVLAAAPAAAPTARATPAQIDEAQNAYHRGHELMQAESFEEAARHFRTAIALDPMHWLAHNGLGQSQMALKRYPDAVQAYRSCREAFLKFASLDATQRAAMERSREDEIREVRDQLLRVQQNAVAGRPDLSAEVPLQERLRILEGARMRGKENVVTVPAGLMLGLGSAYFRTGQRAEAQAAFLEAVKIDPKLGPAHNNLAVVYMMNGQFEEAKQAVKRAEKAGTRVPDSFKQELDRRAREGAGQR